MLEFFGRLALNLCIYSIIVILVFILILGKFKNELSDINNLNVIESFDNEIKKLLSD